MEQGPWSTLPELNCADREQCWACNVMSHLQLLQVAQPLIEKNDEGGAYIITSSVAGQSTGGSSMGYSVSKAAGLHLMKCLAATQGPKLRINAILPGLLLTEWGLRYSEDRIKALKEKAVLKMEVSNVAHTGL